MKKNVYLYVMDTLSDWEVGFLTAELKTGRYFRKDAPEVNLLTVGLDLSPITTMGGLKVCPDLAVEDLNLSETTALILPGGESWTDPKHQPILMIAEQALAHGAVVAGICGATFGLAQAGVLNGRNHTSNDLGYLQMVCPSYVGQAHYQMEMAVTDDRQTGCLITANGIAPLEFTTSVLQALSVFAPDTLEAWYRLYKTQETRYFYDLMASVQ